MKAKTLSALAFAAIAFFVAWYFATRRALPATTTTTTGATGTTPTTGTAGVIAATGNALSGVLDSLGNLFNNDPDPTAP